MIIYGRVFVFNLMKNLQNYGMFGLGKYENALSIPQIIFEYKIWL